MSDTTHSSFWVGLDGVGSGYATVEQTGVRANCAGGKTSYAAWWETFPEPETTYTDVTVKPGDRLSANVQTNDNGTYTMKLSDSTQNWSKTTTHKGGSAAANSSEVITGSRPSGENALQVPDFGSVTFTNCKANGKPLAGDSPDAYNTESWTSGHILVETGALSGGTFTSTRKQGS